MTQKKQRIEWLDMAKGYGIILVIIGHCDMPVIPLYIFAFHIPLFFFLSGYLFSLKDNFKSFIETKYERIIIPYICLSIPMILFALFYNNRYTFGLEDIWEEVSSFIIQKRHTTLWYLSTLLVLNIIMYPIKRYINEPLFKVFIILCLCLSGLFMWQFNIKALPWNIDAALVVIPFFYAGYQLNGKLDGEKIKKTSKLLVCSTILILGIVVGVLNHLNCYTSGKMVDIFNSRFNNEWLTYIVATLGISMVILISMCHQNRIISYIGRNSLLYFAWHQTIILPFLSYVYYKVGISQWTVYKETVIFKWISVVLVLCIITVLNEIITHSKLKFILGKH